MSTRFTLIAVVAAFAITCGRQSPTAPTGRSVSPSQDIPARVDDVSGNGDYFRLIDETDLPGGGFLIEGSSGDAMAGGTLPGDALANSVLLRSPQNVVASALPGGCYIRRDLNIQGAHACLIDRASGRFEGAQSLAGFTSDRRGLLDFSISSGPHTCFFFVEVLPPPNNFTCIPAELTVHAVFRAPRLGNGDFLVEGLVRVDSSFFSPVQPTPVVCQLPIWPINVFGIVGFVRFEGQLPMFGATTGVASICAITFNGRP